MKDDQFFLAAVLSEHPSCPAKAEYLNWLCDDDDDFDFCFCVSEARLEMVCNALAIAKPSVQRDRLLRCFTEWLEEFREEERMNKARESVFGALAYLFPEEMEDMDYAA